MARWLKWINPLCVMALAIAPLAGFMISPRISGDLNRDGAVDILDVQSGILAVVSGAAPMGDLNQDGRTDILDIQRMLSLLAQGEGQMGSPVEPGSQQATPPRPVDLRAGKLDLDALRCASHVVSQEGPSAPVVHEAAIPPLLLLILFSLSPHAPPSKRS